MTRNVSVLSVWLPVLFWTLIIALESTLGSTANTGPILSGIFSWFFDHADPASLERLHGVLRKTGHFLGYGIFGYLWFRAFRATFPEKSRLFWACFALASTVLIASLDEWHQSFTSDRTGQISDVVLDGSGAFLLVAIATIMIGRSRSPC